MSAITAYNGLNIKTLVVKPVSNVLSVQVVRGSDSSPSADILQVTNNAQSVVLFDVKAHGHTRVVPDAADAVNGSWSLAVARSADGGTEPIIIATNHAMNLTLFAVNNSGATVITPDSDVTPLIVKRGTDGGPVNVLFSIRNHADNASLLIVNSSGGLSVSPDADVSVLSLVRGTDTTPAGSLIRATDHAGSSALLFQVAADGSVESPNVLGYNWLDNGNLTVWQRGTSVTPGAAGTAVYAADRWYVVSAGAALTSIAQLAGTGHSGRFGMRLTGATSVTTVNIGQRLSADDTDRLLNDGGTLTVNGGSVTFSFLVTNTTAATITPVLLLGTPTTTSETFSAVTNRLTQNLQAAASGTTALLTYTTTAATLNGYTNIGFGLQVELQLPTTFMNANTKTFDLLAAKVEVGTVSTPIIPVNYQQELARCQRYFYSWISGSTGSFPASGVCRSTTSATVMLKFPVTMRAVPTFAVSATASWWSVYSAASTACSAIPSVAASNTTPNEAAIILTVASGLTAGQGALMLGTNAGATMTFSADL